MQFAQRWCTGAIVVAAAACGPGDSGPGHITTRTGVTKVFEGPAISDPDCWVRDSESGGTGEHLTYEELAAPEDNPAALGFSSCVKDASGFGHCQ